METCKVCGEKSLQEDYENGEKIRVCTECGAMETEPDLTFGDQYAGTTITDGQSQAPHGSKAWMKGKQTHSEKGKLAGKKLITHISKQLNLNDNMITDATELLERVYEDELFKTQEDYRKAMCLACIYATARIYRHPISVRDIAFFLNIKQAAYKFGTALKCLKSKYDVHLPPLGIEDQTYAIMIHSGLSREIIQTTQQLMLILQRALVTQGRGCYSCAGPCAYLAWVATDIPKNRKVSYAEFCRKLKLKFSQKARKGEVQKTLTKMAEELPWVKAVGEKVTCVAVHLQDIIKYQSTLLEKAIQTAVAELENSTEELEGDTDLIKEHGNIFRKDPPKRPPKYEDDDAHFSKKAKTDHESEKKRIKSNAEILESTSHWKASRLPDCHIHKIIPGRSNNRKVSKNKIKSKSLYKKISAEHDAELESLDLGSDDDTDQYILSKHEVKMRQAVFNKYDVFQGKNEHASADKATCTEFEDDDEEEEGGEEEEKDEEEEENNKEEEENEEDNNKEEEENAKEEEEKEEENNKEEEEKEEENEEEADDEDDVDNSYKTLRSQYGYHNENSDGDVEDFDDETPVQYGDSGNEGYLEGV